MNATIKTKTNGIFNGLQLIGAFHNNSLIGLTNIDFLDEEGTIKEYQEWENQFCKTILPVNNKRASLQTVRYSDINSFFSVGYCIKYLSNKYNIEDHHINKYYSFNTLLNRLYDIDTNAIYDYENCIFDYYDQLFRVTKYKLED